MQKQTRTDFNIKQKSMSMKMGATYFCTWFSRMSLKHEEKLTMQCPELPQQKLMQTNHKRVITATSYCSPDKHYTNEM